MDYVRHVFESLKLKCNLGRRCGQHRELRRGRRQREQCHGHLREVVGEVGARVGNAVGGNIFGGGGSVCARGFVVENAVRPNRRVGLRGKSGHDDLRVEIGDEAFVEHEHGN